MTTPRTYSRIYHEIVTHPRFDKVYGNPAALGTWLRMLLTADAMYPMPAPMPAKNPTVRMLISVGLVEELPGNHYTMRGLEAERERRSAVGRNAAQVRHGYERNANALPAKQEQSKEQQIGANAPEHVAGSFMGYRPKASLDDIRRQEEEAWTKCADCGKLGREHSADGKHKFTPGLRSVS